MMGSTTLYNGVNVTCALIGLFSMSQVLILAEKAIKKRAKAAKFTGSLLLSRSDIKRLAPTITRSWIIGNILGIFRAPAQQSPASWVTTKRAALQT